MNKNAMVTIALCGSLLMLSTAAFSQTTTLICTNPYQANTPPFTIDLDQAGGTVTQTVPASQNVAASSSKFQATFDSREIKYKSGDWAYTIDRVTGNVSADGGGGAVMNFPCHVGQKQF